MNQLHGRNGPARGQQSAGLSKDCQRPQRKSQACSPRRRHKHCANVPHFHWAFQHLRMGMSPPASDWQRPPQLGHCHCEEQAMSQSRPHRPCLRGTQLQLAPSVGRGQWRRRCRLATRAKVCCPARRKAQGRRGATQLPKISVWSSAGLISPSASHCWYGSASRLRQIHSQNAHRGHLADHEKTELWKLDDEQHCQQRCQASVPLPLLILLLM
mmetsp:Transcript_55609/g.107286  ORF Transcript_55609/g.107286 Transcript_55609/m.107286 type:complete len:213 (-) Transcript_55609:112-750(-)